MKRCYQVVDEEDEVEFELTGLMWKLPMDILFEILSRVPIRSLSNLCRYVSKAWFNTIKNPRFIQIQHNKVIQSNSFCLLTPDYLFFHEDLEPLESPKTAYEPKLPPTFTTLDSCNGLVFSHWRKHYFICNPITGEREMLPDPPMSHLDDYIATEFGFDVTGFGFDPVSQAFKVVRVSQIPQGDSNNLEKRAQVYTLGTTSWRVISDDVPFDFRCKNSVLFNGALHWLGNLRSSNSGFIISFNLDAEEFQQLPLPPPFQQLLSNQKAWATFQNDPYVKALGECLCVIHSAGDGHTEIWKMEEYGVQSSWVRSYIISNIGWVRGPYDPLQVMMNGKLLLHCGHSDLYYYDLLQRNVDPIHITYQDSPFFREPILGPLLHVGSLISPKSVGRLRRRFMERRKHSAGEVSCLCRRMVVILVPSEMSLNQDMGAIVC